MGVGPLFLSFPRLFRVVVNKASIQDYCVGWGGVGSWNVSFRRAWRLSEESEYESLVSLLSNVFICRDVTDSRIWKPIAFSKFSCKSFSRELEDSTQSKASSSLAWQGLAPPRVEGFAWLVILGQVSTTDNLRRRGLASEAISELCVVQEGD